MILRFLLPFLLLTPLFASEDSWYSKVEVGMYLPTPEGSVSNFEGSSDFENDFGYEKLKASYFALGFVFNYDYIPNIEINYFKMKDNQNTNLNRNVVIADGDFSSSVATIINYNIFNVIVYQDFKQKGRYFPILGKQYYSGDIEFDVGLNAKIIDWRFDIENKENLTQSPSWIAVDEFIPVPYLGVKYYLYDLIAYANISALAFSKAKAVSYQFGVDYRIIDTLYLSAAYLSEEIESTEKNLKESVEKIDTIKFESSGYKLSFKYAF